MLSVGPFILLRLCMDRFYFDNCLWYLFFFLLMDGAVGIKSNIVCLALDEGDLVPI